MPSKHQVAGRLSIISKVSRPLVVVVVIAPPAARARRAAVLNQGELVAERAIHAFDEVPRGHGRIVEGEFAEPKVNLVQNGSDVE